MLYFDSGGIGGEDRNARTSLISSNLLRCPEAKLVDSLLQLFVQTAVQCVDLVNILENDVDHFIFYHSRLQQGLFVLLYSHQKKVNKVLWKKKKKTLMAIASLWMYSVSDSRVSLMRRPLWISSFSEGHSVRSKEKETKRRRNARNCFSLLFSWRH